MFILHTPKSSKPTSIIFKKVFPDGLCRESLGVTILPVYWDKDSERATYDGKEKRMIDDTKSINTLLGKIANFIEARTRDARYTGSHLTCAEMAEKLTDLTGKKKHVKAVTGFYDHCEAIVTDMREGKILTQYGKRYSPDTLKCYEMYLRNFIRHDPDLTWGSINLDFYRSFIKWCNDQDYSLNYIGQHINKLIVLMKEARKRKLHNNTAYLDDDFKKLQEDTDDISLTPAEVITISKKHLPNQLWDIARDWFIIGCYLGLRVSDVKRLNKDVNFTTGSVVIANEKTDTRVAVPINPTIRDIMKKWKGLPPKMTDIEINRYIKKVCEICAINAPVLYFLTKGGNRKDFYLKKYEMVSCHTMRRFFITELLRLKTPDNQVMQLAGIKKHATLLRYKKITPEENAAEMKDHPFFQ